MKCGEPISASISYPGPPLPKGCPGAAPLELGSGLFVMKQYGGIFRKLYSVLKLSQPANYASFVSFEGRFFVKIGVNDWVMEFHPDWHGN